MKLLTAFDKAEELFKQTDENPGKIAALLNNEASLIMTRRDYTKALIYLKQALQIINKNSDVNIGIKVTVYGNLSIIYAFFDNYGGIK